MVDGTRNIISAVKSVCGAWWFDVLHVINHEGPAFQEVGYLGDLGTRNIDSVLKHSIDCQIYAVVGNIPMVVYLKVFPGGGEHVHT